MKKSILLLLIIIIILGIFFSTHLIHFYFYILRKTGLRMPAQIISQENGIIHIDKLDPGESIVVEYIITAEEENLTTVGTEREGN